MRGGKGIQAGDDELSDSCRCIKTGGEAGEDGGVEGVVELQLPTECGHELRGIWLPFLPFGGKRSEVFGRFEHGVELQTNRPPFEPMQDMPGTDAMDVVGDGGSGIRASQAGDECSDDVL